MSAKSTKQIDDATPKAEDGLKEHQLQILVTSFGYKQGPPPSANILFDVRFLKNPYWVEELRPMTGLQKPVQDYVLQQELAQEFLDMLTKLLAKVLPQMATLKVEKFIIAFGCTGGQHRSTTLVEALGKILEENYPQFKITRKHRELERHDEFPDNADAGFASGNAESSKSGGSA